MSDRMCWFSSNLKCHQTKKCGSPLLFLLVDHLKSCQSASHDPVFELGFDGWVVTASVYGFVVVVLR